jgi:acetyl-CoA C-acetyltransferase
MTWAQKRGVAATARLVAYGIAAVEPGMFGLGPVPAVQQGMRRCFKSVVQVCANERATAFAAA